MGVDAKTILFADVERELKVTRTVLERVPAEKFGWKPHEKSMEMGRLAVHVADLTNWLRVALDDDELEFEKVERPPTVTTNEELLAFFDKSVGRLREAIARFDMARLDGMWAMKNGGQVITEKPRLLVVRVWSINHMVHHRGVLCVFLRLLNVPVPAVYFNSSDEPGWVFE